MNLEFSNSDYIAVAMVAPGTAGIAYDCQLGASMRCGSFSGEVEAWVDGAEVKGFVESLEKLNENLRGKATLASDDGRSLFIEVLPSDQLGHFVLKVKMGKDLPIHSKIYETFVLGVFPFESEAMERICRHLIQGVTEKSDA